MEHTPEHSRLVFAAQEVPLVIDLCRSMGLVAVEPAQYKQDVVSHLPHCKVFHFAGHGSTHYSDPSQSSLLLKDWKSDKLTVAKLLELNLRSRSPFLAYLSACGTSEIEDKSFFDKSIHLVSAFQLAGFRHVIGTLWEVNDESCVDMARFTYEGMRDGAMSDESVCLGLHEATRRLRDCWLARQPRRGQTSKRGTLTFTEDETDTVELEEDHRIETRQPRKAALVKDAPLHWVPYVHFGV